MITTHDELMLLDDAFDTDRTASDRLMTLLHDRDLECRDRDYLSHLRLQYSICPLHACDYAICFDDDDPECAAIRSCFPNHDT